VTTAASAARDPLRVEPEAGRRDRREFASLPYRLYRDDPVWVPPLRMADRKTMDRRRNPFFRHAEAQHFLARRGDRVVGRIAACENRRHNEFHGDRTGFFGWFDCEPDPEAARALVEAARGWVAARGLSALRGPVCYSTNDVCGVLVDGFEDRPAILMPWNRPDYDALLRGAGLSPAKDLLAYWVPATTPVPDRFERVCERALSRSGVSIRTLDPRRFADEVRVVKDLYNRCWERNWGFVPATDEEFDHAAKDLKFLVDPRMFLIAERAGKPVGFAGVVLDLNQALVGLDGRMLPFGWARILVRKRRIRRVRILILGVLPEARGKGIDAAFFLRSIQGARACGYDGGEASWILEDNVRMRADLESVGAQVSKRYRLYEMPV
jgi:GNAT superfamily N-acetyltransferase